MYKRWRAGATAAVAIVVGLALLMGTPAPDQPTVAGQNLAVPLTGAPPPGTPDASAPAPAASTPRSPAKTVPTSTVAAQTSAKTPASVRPASAPLAGRIRPGTTYRGKATFYDAGNGDGACLFGAAD